MKKIDRHLTILGGGLSGALLATFLAHRGYQIDLFESRPDLRKHDLPAGRSINLALAHRGIRALKAAGVFESVEPCLIPMRGRMIHPRGEAVQFQPYSQHHDEVIYSVSRNRLSQVLLTAAENTGRVNCHFDHRAKHVDLHQNVVVFEHGETHYFETLIGTDGFDSITRKAITEAAGGTVTIDTLDHGYKELTIPPKYDKFQIEPQALHIWPRGGFMMIALPNQDMSFTATLFLAKSDRRGESFEALSNETLLKQFFEQQFPTATTLMPQYEKTYFDRPLGLLGTLRTDRWHAGHRAMIMGDAAHAIVPFHGQGMNAAFEDALALDLLFGKTDTLASAENAQKLDDNDFKQAINQVYASFQTERKPNADAIADMALENYIEMRDLVLDPSFQLQKQVSFALEKQFPKQFVPRYSLVMFRDLPYAEAKKRGMLQADILKTLTSGKTHLKQVDFNLAEKLINTRL